MKKIIPLLLFAMIGCDTETDTDLTGEWFFVEPPTLQSRINRNDYSPVAFDVVFTVRNKEITDVDLLLEGVSVDATANYIHHGETADITIDGPDFSLKLIGCRKTLQVIFVETIEYQLPNGQTKTYKGLTIGRYN